MGVQCISYFKEYKDSPVMVQYIPVFIELMSMKISKKKTQSVDYTWGENKYFVCIMSSS